MTRITLAEFFSKDAMKVIECRTKEQSDAVRHAFHAIGKKWNSGDTFLNLDYWVEGKTDHIYYYNNCYKGTAKPLDELTIYSFDDIVELSSVSIPEPDPHQLRILLRDDYRWHNACWDGKSKAFSINKNYIKQTDIISVENDPRAKYMKCTNCGSIIKNTKKAIEAHANLSSCANTCLTCDRLRVKEEKRLKESWTKNDDGTYTKTSKGVCLLTCSNRYGNPSVDSVNAREGCRYKRCSASTIVPIDDLFIKYPGVFDDMATIDAINMDKWELNYKNSDNSANFKLKGRYNIYVCTTGLGLVDKFECYYRNSHYVIVYSKKYDKMFRFYSGEYYEITATNSDFSSQYYNALMKIMRDIYKGEN